MAKLFANSGDPDQTPHSAASDLGLHCLPVTLLRISRLQWVKQVGKEGMRVSSVIHFFPHLPLFLSLLSFSSSSAHFLQCSGR